MSYSDLLGTDRDKMRALLGDTSNDSATELLTNAHISAVLTWQSTFDTALAWMAEELAVRYAQKPTNVQLPGGLGVTWGERVAQWRLLAKNARAGLLGDGSSAISFVDKSWGVPETTDEFSWPLDYQP